MYLPATEAGGIQYILNSNRMIGVMARMRRGRICQVPSEAEAAREKSPR